MNNYWIITANLGRLEEGNSEILNQNITMLSTEDLKSNNQVIYNRVFNSIFKILKKAKLLTVSWWKWGSKAKVPQQHPALHQYLL